MRISLIICALLAVAIAQQPKNTVKGQGQMTGANCQFGTVYSLKNNFNFAILSARYTLEPVVTYGTLIAGTNDKLLVVEIALKNVAKVDSYFTPEGQFVAVDETGKLIEEYSFGVRSALDQPTEFGLKPGQGLGQPELKNPLSIVFRVPARSRIVKIIVNQGRLNTNEQVLRYYIAGATKAEAGADGDPKNVIAPLPANVRDGPAGALALAEGKGEKGVYLPSGAFALRLDNFAYSTTPIEGIELEEGQKYAVATITAKALTMLNQSMFEVWGGDEPLYQIVDSDGERVRPIRCLKARRDEDAEHEFKMGEEYAFRIIFVLPADATAKKLTIGTSASRKWTFSL